MKSQQNGPPRAHPPPEVTAGEWFAARSLAALVGVVGAGVVFALLLVLVAREWEPLRAVDAGAVDGLNAVVSGRGWLVSVLHVATDLGSSYVSWTLLSVTVVWLLVRRAGRLAAWVAVTGLGAAVLDPGIKAAVGRVRPLVDVPVASAPGGSFPSGHALGATVTYGVLVLVFLPAVPPRFRRAVVGLAVGVVLLVGVTRVALGVHHPTDVVAGWLLGALWLTATATAFRRWRREEGHRAVPLSAGLAPEDRPAVLPAPGEDRDVEHPGQGVARLLVAAVVIWGALLGVGLLITEVLTGLQQAEVAFLRELVALRTPAVSTVMVLVGHLGGTRGIIAVLLVAAALSLALTRRWRPGAFLVVAVVGESALFLATATVIGRERPPVVSLSPPLPPTSSFPSGHVAAAAVLYGGIALLVTAYRRGWLARLAVAAAVLVVALVTASRLYRGVHYPTDVTASLLFAGAWLAVCWLVLRPGPPGRREARSVGRRGGSHPVGSSPEAAPTAAAHGPAR